MYSTSPFFSDLIETLWNVKGRSSMVDSQRGIRFNRNIVECKERTEDITKQLREAI